MPVSDPRPPLDPDDIQTLLEQHDRRRAFERTGRSVWTVVYESWEDEGSWGLWSCAFASTGMRSDVLSGKSWSDTLGIPGFMESYENGTKRTYLRYGDDSGFEPIVIFQDHHGIRPQMLPQLSEEFRLYHNLWGNEEGTELTKVNDDGSEDVAARVSHHRVQVRTKYLRQFQAGRQLDLVLRMDSYRRVSDPDKVAQLHDTRSPDEQGYMRITIFVLDEADGRTEPHSRLSGRKVLQPPTQSKAGVWPFDKPEENYPEFVIGENVDGEPVKYTCNPEELANNVGKNPGSPNYLTPVWFHKDVLQRYHELPEKYLVTDGHLRCGRLWLIQIDNDHTDQVMVFLGDLGRDLPEAERYHWLSHNIVPTKRISRTSYERSFRAEPTDPALPDLSFKLCYSRFKQKWSDKFGWDLFKDPEPDDAHVFQRLRIPLNDSAPEFENQVLGLAKVLVDSLNEKAILNQLPNKVANEKGISKFERWLLQEGYTFTERDVTFLKRLWLLRSMSAAHRKGSNYRAVLAKEKVDDDRVKEVTQVFANAQRLLEDLANHFTIDLEPS